jgi:DivIVA domain-containing protein
MAQGDRFRRKALKRGYKVDEVDEFLDRAEATLARRVSGEPVSAADVRDVVFRTRFGGYDEWQVDLHLDRLEKELEELSSGLPSRGSNGFPALEAGPSAYQQKPAAEIEAPAYAGYATEAPSYGGGQVSQLNGYRGEPSGAYGRPRYRQDEADHGERQGYGAAAAGYRDGPSYNDEPAYRDGPSYGDEPGYRDEPDERTGGYRSARPEPPYGGQPAGANTYGGQPAAANTYGGQPAGANTYGGQAAGANTYGGQPAAANGYRDEPSGDHRTGQPYGGRDRDPSESRTQVWAAGESYRDDPRYREEPAAAAPAPYAEPYREEQPSHNGTQYGNPAGYGAAARYGADTGAYEQPAYAEPSGPQERPGYVEEPSRGDRSRYAEYATQIYPADKPYADRGRYVESGSYGEQAPYAERSYGEGSRFASGAQYVEQGAAGSYETGYQEAPSYSESSPRQAPAPAYQAAQPAAVQYQGGTYGRGRGTGGYPQQYDDAPSYGDAPGYGDGPSYGDVAAQPAPIEALSRRPEPSYRGGGRTYSGDVYAEPEMTGAQPSLNATGAATVPPPRGGRGPAYGDAYRDPDFGTGRHGQEVGDPGPGHYTPFTNEDKALVGELRSSFRPRRFGSGYDPAQVERLFDAIQAMQEGRGGQVSDADLMPGQFGLVQGGYFEDDVDEALRQVRGLFNRRIG